ncbi:helix-turn-helix domain-containing protein [Streptococcus plurextorum]|uniref:helix-turn-helix domain-containing protein n=1 Tax=Streptococcus plurextorum TaxID=456876 RepID=UPI000421C4C2|nr:helix-turn-helix transcriptional regulator [Streptococcus plurextorum]
MNNTILVGLRIKSIRKKLGETMETFGERFHVGKGTVNNWEKGRSIPKKPTLCQISQVGNIAIDELLYGDKSEYIEYLFDAKEEETVQEYTEINRKQFHDVVQEKKVRLLEKDLSNWSYNRILKKVNNIFEKITRDIPLTTDDMLLEIVGTLNTKMNWVRGLYDAEGLKKKGAIKNNNLDLTYYDDVMGVLLNARSEISKLREKLDANESKDVDLAEK